LATYGTVDKKDTANPEKRYLLVVESDTYNLSYLSTLLQRFNYPTISVATAQEAAETMETIVPFLIIISLSLTDLSGYELMHRLKEHPRTSKIPLIAVSEHEDLNIRKKCLTLGAIAVLSHPINAELLYHAVQVAIEKNPRSCMRVQVTHPVKVNDAWHDCFYGAYTVDLSERGIFLRTMNPAKVKSQLSLQLALPGRVINTEAEVLYSCKAGEGPFKETGIGLKFIRIELKDQEHLRHFIREEVTRGIMPGQS